jgi:hypothetical protein
MKISQKIKRIPLAVSNNEDFLLLGVVSADPDYKLSLQLNKKFKISLKNTTPVRFSDDSQNELLFSRFSYNDDSAGMLLNLVSNKSDKSFLIRKLKNIDYFIQVYTQEKNCSPEEITSRLREIETINAVFNIDLKNFKDKNLQYLIQ